MKNILSTALFLLSTVVFSQEKPMHKIDVELKICLAQDENKSTAKMAQCFENALAEWDLELNATYKVLQSKLDSGAKKKLVDAQRQWIKFKDSEIALIEATYGKAKGTSYRIIRIDKVLNITRTRTEALQTLLVDLQKM